MQSLYPYIDDNHIMVYTSAKTEILSYICCCCDAGKLGEG